MCKKFYKKFCAFLDWDKVATVGNYVVRGARVGIWIVFLAKIFFLVLLLFSAIKTKMEQWIPFLLPLGEKWPHWNFFFCVENDQGQSKQKEYLSKMPGMNSNSKIYFDIIIQQIILLNISDQINNTTLNLLKHKAKLFS